MALTFENVQYIAKLSKLDFSEETLPAITEDLNHIISMVDKINDQNTDDIAPLAHPLDMSQPVREDIATEKNQRDAFLAIAPKTQDGLYVVPTVIETE